MLEGAIQDLPLIAAHHQTTATEAETISQRVTEENLDLEVGHQIDINIGKVSDVLDLAQLAALQTGVRKVNTGNQGSIKEDLNLIAGQQKATEKDLGQQNELKSRRAPLHLVHF